MHVIFFDKVYVGCFPSDANMDLFVYTLYHDMVYYVSSFFSYYSISGNGGYFAFSYALTIETCISFCLSNKYFFAGVSG